MMNLVYKEFVQLRLYLLEIAGFMALAVIVFGKANPDFAMSYVYVFPVVLGLTLPQIVFGQEERGNTFAFLRSLPIRPSEIVAAKYLVSAVVTVVFLALIGLAGALRVVPLQGVYVAVSAVGFASFALAGISFFAHFWLGQKQARVALLLITFTLAIPVMLLSRGGGSTAAILGAKLAWLEPLVTSPDGVCVALAAGLAVFSLSFVSSAWLFAKRDLSRLP